MAKFAHVYVAKTKAFETVKESELKDLDPDKKTKLDVSLDSVSICSLDKKYAIVQDNRFRRVFVCYTADTEEDLIQKVNNPNTSRIRIPKRNSMGPMEYSAEDFIKKGNQDECAATKAKAVDAQKSVQQKRLELIAKNEQEIDSERKPKPAGGFKKRVSKKGTSTARKDEDVIEQGNKDEREAKKAKDGDAEISVHQEQLGMIAKNKQEIDSIGQHKSADEFNKGVSKKGTSTPQKTPSMMLTNECSGCAALRTALSKTEEQNASLLTIISEQSEQLKKLKERESTINDMESKMGTPCAALQSEDKPGKASTSSKKKSKICPVPLTNRIDDSDSEPEEITNLEGYIYIGKWLNEHRFVPKSKLARLDKVLFFSKRFIAVMMMVWGEENASNYSMRGGKDGKGKVKEKVLPFHLKACQKLLKLLSWEKVPLGPIKLNKKMFEPLTKEFVDRYVGKFLTSPQLEAAYEEAKIKDQAGAEGKGNDRKEGDERQRKKRKKVDESDEPAEIGKNGEEDDEGQLKKRKEDDESVEPEKFERMERKMMKGNERKGRKEMEVMNLRKLERMARKVIKGKERKAMKLMNL